MEIETHIAAVDAEIAEHDAMIDDLKSARKALVQKKAKLERIKEEYEQLTVSP